MAAAKLTPDDYIPKVEVEAELEPSKVTIDLVEELDKLEPYGMGNPNRYLAGKIFARRVLWLLAAKASICGFRLARTKPCEQHSFGIMAVWQG